MRLKLASALNYSRGLARPSGLFTFAKRRLLLTSSNASSSRAMMGDL